MPEPESLNKNTAQGAEAGRANIRPSREPIRTIHGGSANIPLRVGSLEGDPSAPPRMKGERLKNIIITCGPGAKRAAKLKARIERLEVQMANEVQDLQALKASVDAHNAADAQFQTDVNTKIAALEAAQASGDTTAIDAAIADLKTSIGSMPTLTLPA